MSQTPLIRCLLTALVWSVPALADSLGASRASLQAGTQVSQPSEERTLGNKFLEFETLTRDFGDIGDQNSVSMTFPFVNTGEGDVRVLRVTTSCGCTTAALEKRTYAPGEGAEITATYDPRGRSGRDRKTITVTALEDGATRIYRLTIYGQVKALARLERKTISLGGMAKGEGASRTIKLFSRDPDIEITGIELEDPDAVSLEVGPKRVETTAQGESLTVMDITASTNGFPRSGPFKFDATLTTNLEGRPRLKATISGRVFTDLKPTAWSVNLGTIPAGASFRADMTLVHTKDLPFNILSWEHRGQGLKIELEHGVLPEGSEHGVGRSMVIAGTALKPGRFSRESIRITTDLEDEAPITIMFNAMIE